MDLWMGSSSWTRVYEHENDSCMYACVYVCVRVAYLDGRNYFCQAMRQEAPGMRRQKGQLADVAAHQKKREKRKERREKRKGRREERREKRGERREKREERRETRE